MSAMQILISHGLNRIAVRLCEEMSLSTMSDLAGLSDEQIDMISWLKPQQNNKLKALCEACRRGNPNLLEESSTQRKIADRGAENTEHISVLLGNLAGMAHEAGAAGVFSQHGRTK